MGRNIQPDLETVPMLKDMVDEARLAQFEAQFAELRYETVGMVEALILSPKPDQHLSVPELRVLPESGVEGQYPGKQWWRGKRVPGRQISAINAEALDVLGVRYEIPGDNLIIRGIDLSLFAPGDTLRIGEAALTVTPTPHRPCAKFARRTSLTQKTAISPGKRRGILLDALQAATISVGDPVERILLSSTDV